MFEKAEGEENFRSIVIGSKSVRTHTQEHTRTRLVGPKRGVLPHRLSLRLKHTHAAAPFLLPSERGREGGGDDSFRSLT